MPKLLYPKCPTVTYYYDPTVEFLLGQLFHTLIYNEVGLPPLWLVVLSWACLLGYIEKPLTTKPFLILSKSLRETLGHSSKKNGSRTNDETRTPGRTLLESEMRKIVSNLHRR